MAGVSIISFALRDDAGQRSSMPIYVPDSVAASDLGDLADAIAAKLDAVTGAVIEGITIAQGHALPAGLKVVKTADSLNGVGALFNFDAADTVYSHSIYVPALRPSLYQNGAVLATDAAITEFVTAIQDGTLAADPSDRFANDLLLLNGVSLKFRKS